MVGASHSVITDSVGLLRFNWPETQVLPGNSIDRVLYVRSMIEPEVI